MKLTTEHTQSAKSAQLEAITGIFPILNSRRLPSLFLSTLIGVALIAPPAAALIYYSPSGYTKVVNPGLACWRRPFDFWTRKHYQSFKGTIYPKQALLPCRRGRPNAVISGTFEIFKLSGDRMEACRGKATLWFSNWGRNLRATWQTTGAVRGMYCRNPGRNQTLSFRIRR